ncbi:hypothetical protein C8J56DRAFT_893075 [Mycena floridula]|nr:hypothetical protein C8J56DRAFT_893075 [Mycena floridula]
MVTSSGQAAIAHLTPGDVLINLQYVMESSKRSQLLELATVLVKIKPSPFWPATIIGPLLAQWIRILRLYLVLPGADEEDDPFLQGRVQDFDSRFRLILVEAFKNWDVWRNYCVSNQGKGRPSMFMLARQRCDKISKLGYRDDLAEFNLKRFQFATLENYNAPFLKRLWNYFEVLRDKTEIPLAPYSRPNKKLSVPNDEKPFPGQFTRRVSSIAHLQLALGTNSFVWPKVPSKVNKPTHLATRLSFPHSSRLTASASQLSHPVDTPVFNPGPDPDLRFSQQYLFVHAHHSRCFAAWKMRPLATAQLADVVYWLNELKFVLYQKHLIDEVSKSIDTRLELLRHAELWTLNSYPTNIGFPYFNREFPSLRPCDQILVMGIPDSHDPKARHWPVAVHLARLDEYFGAVLDAALSPVIHHLLSIIGLYHHIPLPLCDTLWAFQFSPTNPFDFDLGDAMLLLRRYNFALPSDDLPWPRGEAFGVMEKLRLLPPLPAGPPFDALDAVLPLSHSAHLFHQHWLQVQSNFHAAPPTIRIPRLVPYSASSIPSSSRSLPAQPIQPILIIESSVTPAVPPSEELEAGEIQDTVASPANQSSLGLHLVPSPTAIPTASFDIEVTVISPPKSLAPVVVSPRPAPEPLFLEGARDDESRILSPAPSLLQRRSASLDAGVPVPVFDDEDLQLDLPNIRFSIYRSVSPKGSNIAVTSKNPSPRPSSPGSNFNPDTLNLVFPSSSSLKHLLVSPDDAEDVDTNDEHNVSRRRSSKRRRLRRVYDTPSSDQDSNRGSNRSDSDSEDQDIPQASSSLPHTSICRQATTRRHPTRKPILVAKRPASTSNLRPVPRHFQPDTLPPEETFCSCGNTSTPIPFSGCKLPASLVEGESLDVTWHYQNWTAIGRSCHRCAHTGARCIGAAYATCLKCKRDNKSCCIYRSTAFSAACDALVEEDNDRDISGGNRARFPFPDGSSGTASDAEYVLRVVTRNRGGKGKGISKTNSSCQGKGAGPSKSKKARR